MKAIVTTIVFAISIMGFSQTENRKEDVVPVNSKVYPLKQLAENTFKIFTVVPTHTAWARQQDVYNDIRAKVPGMVISGVDGVNATPAIRLRGSANAIVIVDGVRYDASILNVLNPADIESVKISNNLGAQSYFRNQ